MGEGRLMIIAVADTCAFGGITLGQTDVDDVEWYFLGIDGWGAPGSTSQPIQRGRGDGGFASEAWLKYRTFTIQGAIVAPDRPSMVAAQDALNAAASIQQQALTIVNGGTERTVLGAQRQDDVLYKETSPISVEFAITFVAVDPRKFGEPITYSTFLPQSTGGLTVPFAVPFTIASTVVTGQVTMTNPGNTAGKVLMRIDGPVTGPVISHVATGAQLVFATSLVLNAGEWLDIDMDARTILANGQSSRAGYVTTRGWSQFDPGGNTWAFTAPVFDAGSKLTVTAYPSWL
jgi:hypothetical protein